MVNSMTNFEIYSLNLACANIALLIIGFCFAYLQLKAASREIHALNQHHSDYHDWHRRHATQEALRYYNYSLLSSPLQTSFDYLNSAESISVTQIEERFKENPNLLSDLHQLLNSYEALARGVNQGIFDEDVLKSARRNAMVRCERSFRNYIEMRRQNISPRAWIEFSYITQKWSSEITSVEVRPLTGIKNLTVESDTKGVSQ